MTPVHTADHRLPISYGVSMSGRLNGPLDDVSVRCGRCRGFFRPDLDWVERYFTSKRCEVDRQHERGYYSAGQHLDATNYLDAQERDIRAFLEAE